MDWPVTVSILRDGTLNGVLYGAGLGAATSVTAQGPANSVLVANAGAPSFTTNPTLTSLTLTTPLAIASGGIGAVSLAAANIAVTTGTLAQFAATTSAQLAGVISDETGSGLLVFATAPVFTTSISTPSIITASGALGITPASGSNLNVTLATTGDFAVNTNQLYVDTSAAKVGINIAAPTQVLDIRATQAGVNIQSSTGTNAAFTAFVNTSGTLYVGVDSSVGGTLLAGSTAYSSIICSVNNQALQFGTNNVLRLTITNGGNFAFAGGSIGFFGVAVAVQQTSGANLTNNVTSGGTTDTIADFTSLTVYASDAAAIRNDIYQLARKLKQINDGLRLFGLFT